MYKNSEKYSDPTAGEALAHISYEEHIIKRETEWISIVTSGKKLILRNDQPHSIKQYAPQTHQALRERPCWNCNKHPNK